MIMTQTMKSLQTVNSIILLDNHIIMCHKTIHYVIIKAFSCGYRHMIKPIAQTNQNLYNGFKRTIYFIMWVETLCHEILSKSYA